MKSGHVARAAFNQKSVCFAFSEPIRSVVEARFQYLASRQSEKTLGASSVNFCKSQDASEGDTSDWGQSARAA